MAKFRKGSNDNKSFTKKTQKPGNKQQIPGPVPGTGIVKAKNKINNLPGKGNVHAKLNLLDQIGDKAFKMRTKLVQNNQKLQKGNNLQQIGDVQNEQKGNKPQGIANVQKKHEQPVLVPQTNILKTGEEPVPLQIFKKIDQNSPEKKKSRKNKDLKSLESPTIVQSPQQKKLANAAHQTSKIFNAGKGPIPLHKLEKPEQVTPEKKESKKKNAALKSLASPAEVEQSPPSKLDDKSSNADELPFLKNAGPFNTEDFEKIITRDKIEQMSIALKNMFDEECKKQMDQVLNNYKYILNVKWFKASGPERLVKLKLEHSLLSEDDDVCFFIRDSERCKHFDPEITKEKFEDILKAKGITSVKTVIPLNQLKTEYGSCEMKNKLSNAYEAFICDDVIFSEVIRFLGQKYQKMWCTPFPVRMNTDNLAREIKGAFQKTSYRQGGKAIMTSIPIGTSKMTTDQLLDNLTTVLAQLKELNPGGYENIRSLYLKINVLCIAPLPIYISMCRPPATVPNVVGPKKETFKKIKANEFVSKFHMTSDGRLQAIRTNGKSAVGQKRPAVQATNADSTKYKKVKKEIKENSENIESVKKSKELVVNAKNAKAGKRQPIIYENGVRFNGDDDSNDEDEVVEAPKNKKISRHEMLQAGGEYDTDESDDDYLCDDKESDDDDDSTDEEEVEAPKNKKINKLEVLHSVGGLNTHEIDDDKDGSDDEDESFDEDYFKESDVDSDGSDDDDDDSD